MSESASDDEKDALDALVVAPVNGNGTGNGNKGDKVNKVNKKNADYVPNKPLVPRDNLFRKIGVLDPEGAEFNPYTGKPYQNLYANDRKTPGTYAELAGNFWTKLPVYKMAKEIIQAIADNQVLLLVSATGSGKTVMLPPLCSHYLSYTGRIAVSNPKSLPTKENAEFAAKLRDVVLGEQIGFKYKGSKIGSGKSMDVGGVKSRVVYCTDGMILAWLSHDPLLSDYDAVILDEVHERNVNIDLVLGLIKFTLKKRPDFRLIIMSATVNAEVFERYYPSSQFKFAKMDLPGETLFPIEEIFAPKAINKIAPNGAIEASFEKPAGYIKYAVDTALKIMADPASKGDILVFIAGKNEALDGCEYLKVKTREFPDMKPFCVQLHSKTSDEDKKLAVNATLYQNAPGKPFTKKIVFATEIAESSITIKNLGYVIDSGLSKVQRFYPGPAVEALEKRYISKAAHRQRKGRAGRTAPGTCYDVFTEEEYKKDFLDYSVPPILREDLTAHILAFMASKYVSHVELPFSYKKSYPEEYVEAVSLDHFLFQLIDPPHVDFVNYTLRLLVALGALEPVAAAPAKPGVKTTSVAKANAKTNSKPNNTKTNTKNNAAENDLVKGGNKKGQHKGSQKGSQKHQKQGQGHNKKPQQENKQPQKKSENGVLPTKSAIYVLSPVGIGMSRFRMLPPQMARAVLASYDYLKNSPRERRDDVVVLGAILETVEGSFDKLFERPPRTSKFSREEAQKLEAAYKKARKNFATKYGDATSILNAYHTMAAILRPTGGTEGLTEEQKGALSAKANKFARDNFINLNARKVKDIMKLVDDYSRVLNQIARELKDVKYYEKYIKNQTLEGEVKFTGLEEFREKLRTREFTVDNDKYHQQRLFIPDDAHVYPAESAMAHANNMLLALFNGYYTCYAEQVTRGRYRTVFPLEKTLASVDRYSFINDLKAQPKYVFYMYYTNIEGRASLNVVSYIPSTVVEKAPKEILEILKFCMKA